MKLLKTVSSDLLNKIDRLEVEGVEVFPYGNGNVRMILLFMESCVKEDVSSTTSFTNKGGA